MRAENKEQGDTKNTPTNKLNDIHSRQEEKVLAALKPIIDERIRYDVPGCMEGTRRSVFEEIDAWLNDFSTANVLWISGSPGSGKSDFCDLLPNLTLGQVNRLLHPRWSRS